MDSRIGRLHSRYRIAARDLPTDRVAARLDRLARERLPGELGSAFDRLLGGDPVVYVVRGLEARLALDLGEDASDDQIASRWAEQLAGALGRLLVRNPDGSADLVRFDDRAEFVARFAADLLDGDAWGRWIYRPFEPYRDRGRVADVLLGVLLDHRDDLPAILARLHRLGRLGRTLAALDPPALREIWLRIRGGELAPDREGTRPLVALAVRLLTRLDLWRGPPPEVEAICDAYVAAGPIEVDWRDRRALTEAMLDILRFLAALGSIRRAAAPIEGIEVVAIAEFDWLDLELVGITLGELTGGGSPRPDEPDAPGTSDAPAPGQARPSGVPTPHLGDLLGDLLTVVRRGSAPLDPDRPDSPTNGLALFAALVDHSHRWADDATATAVIREVLAAWACLRRSGAIAGALSVAEVLPFLRRGEVEAALRGWPADARDAAARSLLAVARLGPMGPELLGALAGGAAFASPSTPDRSTAGRATIETGCAGVFFLLRAIQDLRLIKLIDEARPPQSSGAFERELLLASMGLALAGRDGVVDGRLDPALAFLAGLGRPPTLPALADAWDAVEPAFHARLGEAVTGQLAGLRMLAGDVLHAYPIGEGGDRLALVAGGQAVGPWPLGRVAFDLGGVPAILREWRDLWEESTGERPDVLIGDARLAGLWVELPRGDLAGLLEEHRAGESALVAALNALGHGRLGREEADLTSSLMAIALVRAWARWLPRFERSSVPYLLENLLRRPGRLVVGGGEVLVEYERGPLDIVLELAGYLADLERVAWLGDRRVRFRPL